MIDLRRPEGGQGHLEPLTWWPLVVGNFSNDLSAVERQSASIVCGAGHFGTIEDHEISEDGVVSPSVECPVAFCSWHESIRLVGWPA